MLKWILINKWIDANKPVRWNLSLSSSKLRIYLKNYHSKEHLRLILKRKNIYNYHVDCSQSFRGLLKVYWTIIFKLNHFNNSIVWKMIFHCCFSVHLLKFTYHLKAFTRSKLIKRRISCLKVNRRRAAYRMQFWYFLRFLFKCILENIVLAQHKRQNVTLPVPCAYGLQIFGTKLFYLHLCRHLQRCKLRYRSLLQMKRYSYFWQLLLKHCCPYLLSEKMNFQRLDHYPIQQILLPTIQMHGLNCNCQSTTHVMIPLQKKLIRLQTQLK